MVSNKSGYEPPESRKAIRFDPDLPAHLLGLNVRESEIAMQHKQACLNELIGKFPSFAKGFAIFEDTSKEVRETMREFHSMLMGDRELEKEETRQGFIAATLLATQRLEYLKEGVQAFTYALRLMPELYRSASMHHLEGCIEEIIKELRAMTAELEELEATDGEE